MYNDYYDSIAKVAETDSEVADAMALELKRQRENIELIASENLVSPQVMAAMGSVLTNKYAEGLPSKRYYGGCQYVDLPRTACAQLLPHGFFMFSKNTINFRACQRKQKHFAVLRVVV